MMSSNPISFEAARKQMIACQPAAAFAFSLP
jgi:hypothetical protein